MLEKVLTALDPVMVPLMEVGSNFDWMTPLINEAGGFTALAFSGDYASAVAHKQGLEAKGIACRLEGGGWFTNTCVYTQPGAVEPAAKEEWACSHCGTPNPRARTGCASCGATRDFTY